MVLLPPQWSSWIPRALASDGAPLFVPTTPLLLPCITLRLAEDSRCLRVFLGPASLPPQPMIHMGFLKRLTEPNTLLQLSKGSQSLRLSTVTATLFRISLLFSHFSSYDSKRGPRLLASLNQREPLRALIHLITDAVLCPYLLAAPLFPVHSPRLHSSTGLPRMPSLPHACCLISFCGLNDPTQHKGRNRFC